jgi:hypothetical protein
MAHIPVNHRLRPLYRVLAALAGLYILAFGIVGVTKTNGLDFFAREGLPWVLGLKTNMAFSILSIVFGALIVVGAILGGNLDHFLNIGAGAVFVVAGMAMLALMQTDANVLGFTVATCVVSFLVGMLLFVAGLYGKVGTETDAAVEERFRHGAGADPTEHLWADREAGDAATANERFA